MIRGRRTGVSGPFVELDTSVRRINVPRSRHRCSWGACRPKADMPRRSLSAETGPCHTLNLLLHYTLPHGRIAHAVLTGTAAAAEAPKIERGRGTVAGQRLPGELWRATRFPRCTRAVRPRAGVRRRAGTHETVRGRRCLLPRGRLGGAAAGRSSCWRQAGGMEFLIGSPFPPHHRHQRRFPAVTRHNVVRALH